MNMRMSEDFHPKIQYVRICVLYQSGELSTLSVHLQPHLPTQVGTNTDKARQHHAIDIDLLHLLVYSYD